MAANTFFILALILFDGVAVGWGAWQYWTVRPTKTPKADEPAAGESGSAQDPGHPEG